MKKKICIIVFVCVLVFGLISFCIAASLNYGYIEGRVLIADNGAYLIILSDHSPIRMTDASLSGGLFENLKTGDRISAICGNIQESYPGNTSVYYIRHIEKGTEEDIFPDVIQILKELGWLTK